MQAGAFAAADVDDAPGLDADKIEAFLHAAIHLPRQEIDRTGKATIAEYLQTLTSDGAGSIPKSFGTSIAATGGAEAALYGFLAFYLSCIAITWWFYTRPGGLLFDVERGGPSSPTPAPTPAR